MGNIIDWPKKYNNKEWKLNNISEALDFVEEKATEFEKFATLLEEKKRELKGKREQFQKFLASEKWPVEADDSWKNPEDIKKTIAFLNNRSASFKKFVELARVTVNLMAEEAFLEFMERDGFKLDIDKVFEANSFGFTKACSEEELDDFCFNGPMISFMREIGNGEHKILILPAFITLEDIERGAPTSIGITFSTGRLHEANLESFYVMNAKSYSEALACVKSLAPVHY